jgi:uncharacterized protein (DUF1330 family)
MAHEMLIGLDVADPALYQEYRAAMRPLLEAAGGGFRYDFEIARTLRSEASHPINRVFAIHFPDASTRDRFYADREYLRIRERLLVPAVRGRTILAEYER